MSAIVNLKHAAKAAAAELGVKVPDGFNVETNTMGAPFRTLLRRIAASKPPVVWTPAKVMLWLHAHGQGKMIYSENASRMQGVREKIRPPKLTIHEDCSSTATYAYWLSGRPDPNGLGYNGTGNTTTLREHGHVVPLAEVKPDDLIFYANPEHVAVAVGGGNEVSFGYQGGPELARIGHYRPVQEVRRYS